MHKGLRRREEGRGRKKKKERGWEGRRGGREERREVGGREGGRVTCSKSQGGGTSYVGSGCLPVLQTLAPNLHQCL